MTGLSGPTSSGLRDGRRARQLLALADRPTFRLLGLGIGLVAAVAVLAGITWWVGNGYLAGDTLTYWLAGHRLDIGHGLYSVRPDDPWLFDIRPYGLLSPPSLAVPWVGLAALPGTSDMLRWLGQLDHTRQQLDVGIIGNPAIQKGDMIRIENPLTGIASDWGVDTYRSEMSGEAGTYLGTLSLLPWDPRYS